MQSDEVSKLPDMGLLMPDAVWKKLKTGIPKFEPGRWVRYRVTHPELNLGTLEFKIVPQKSLRNPAMRILEIKATDATGDTNYVKLLYSRSSTDPSNLRGVAFKLAHIAPMVLPLDSGVAEGMGFAVETEIGEQGHAKVTFKGTETVTVPAGIYKTWHYDLLLMNTEGKPYHSSMWFDTSGAVPVFRLVKARTDETVLELVAQGAGAKSDLPPFPAAEKDQGKGSEKTR